jgi:hypothetical protein
VPRSTCRRVRTALAALALVAAAAARAAPIQISWDPELAFDYDRANYEKGLRELVEQGYAMVSAETGLSLERPLQVKVLTGAHYENQFGTQAAWLQGARYSAGAIHVNGGSRFTEGFAGLLVHELTHAVLDHRGTARGLPLWLNEGLAERMSWRRKGVEDLSFAQRTELRRAAAEKQLVPLPAWGQVTFTYLQCYAAALFFERKQGKDVMMQVIRRTLDGEPFERALDHETRWGMEDFHREFVGWVEHL